MSDSSNSAQRQSEPAANPVSPNPQQDAPEPLGSTACSLDWFREWTREADKHKLIRLRIFDDVNGTEVHVSVYPDGVIETLGDLAFLNWVAGQLPELQWPESFDAGEGRQIYKRTGNPAEHMVVIPGNVHPIYPNSKRLPIGPHGEAESFREFMARKKAEQDVSGATSVLPLGGIDVPDPGASVEKELDSGVL